MSVSPSNLERRIICPGSEREEAKIGYVPGGPAAERGKMLHGLLEHILKTAEDLKLTGTMKMTLDGSEIARLDLSQEDLEQVNFCYQELLPHLREAQVYGDLILIEHEIDLGEIGMSNHARIDFAIVRPGKWAKIFDAKFGVWPERHPAFNWQMRAYAVGVAINFGVEEVSATILQPALDAPNNVKSAVYAAELPSLYGTITAFAKATKEPNAPLVVSEKSCQWCNAKMVCPARQGAIMGVLPRGTAIREFYNLSAPDQRQKLYEQLLLAKEWVEQAVEESKEYILSGGEVPGFRIGAGKEGRYWNNEELAIAEMAEIASTKGIKNEAIFELISPSKAEKLFGKSAEVKKKLEMFINKKPGNPTVIRDKGADL